MPSNALKIFSCVNNAHSTVIERTISLLLAMQGFFFLFMNNAAIKKILNKTLSAFLVNPFREIPKSGNSWLKDMNIFITSWCILPNGYPESLIQFLRLPGLHENDCSPISTRKLILIFEKSLLIYKWICFILTPISERIFFCVLFSDLYFPVNAFLVASYCLLF